MHYQNVIKYLRPTTCYVAAALAATLFMKKDITIGKEVEVPIVVEAKAMSDVVVEQEEIEQEEVHAEPVEETVIVETIRRNWSDGEIEELINQGFFTRDDFIYLTAVGGECYNDYDGFYAVASCVLNRIKSGRYSSIHEVVTATDQFLGYNDPISNWKTYNRYCTQEVKDAAVNVLLGGESNIGDCYYFRGRVNDHDMWADPNITEFYVWAGNVFYTMADSKSGNEVHNMHGEESPSHGILIYDHNQGYWNFASGERFVNNGGVQ